MPQGLLGKLFGGVKEWGEGQRENWRTAREREAAGGSRNPFLKTRQEQAEMASQRAGETSYPVAPGSTEEMAADSRNIEGRKEISQVANRALASEMSSGRPDVASGSMDNFDPSDPDSVLSMQKALNRAGIKDEYGEALSEDSQMGPKTLSAIRAMQKTRGQFIGPEGSDVTGLNQAVQETTGRKADTGTDRNALMNPRNWLDSIFQRKDPFGPGGRLGATTEDYGEAPTQTMPSREDRDRGANLWRR